MKLASNIGYADEADELLVRYEKVAFETAHQDVLDLLPKAPARVIDIGAGTGRDAAWFAARGHFVLAVEPTDEMREGAMRLHPDPRITWLDDGLPDLAVALGRNERFNLLMLTAVWMHLDADERVRGMASLAKLAADNATIILSLRHGPVPEGRRMFEVRADETIALAAPYGFRAARNLRDARDASQRRPGISWTKLVLTRP